MLLRDILIITIGGTIVSSLYLISDQKSQNWTAKHHGTSLSNWYLIDSFFDSSFGFAVNVIWPYIISGWISYKFGIVLLIYCFGTDELFRIFWFVYHDWFHQNINQKNIYLCAWATVNDTNSYLVIPLIVWIYYCYYAQNNDQTEQTVELIPENNQIINEMNRSSHNIEKLKKIATSHFNKIIISYIVSAIWFIVQDGYQYYYQNEKWSPILRLPPFVFTSLLFSYEIYVCKQHKKQPFVHFILLCLFIMCQELLFDWGVLVFKINTLTTNWNKNVAKITVFSCYTVYFKILSLISGLLTQHISHTKRVVYKLHFIFIVFFDVYLTLYLSASKTIDWTIAFMIVIKLFAKFIKFNKKVRSYVPYLNDRTNNKRMTIHYVYSIIASCVVYIGQTILLLIDYVIYTGNTGWILSPISATKTIHNLTISMILLFISFVTEAIAFYLVFKTSKNPTTELTSNQSSINIASDDDNDHERKLQLQNQADRQLTPESITSSEYNIHDTFSEISLPIVYFVCVVAYSQIAALNVTQFFPWEFS